METDRPRPALCRRPASAVPGVAQVTTGGARKPAMRIWLDRMPGGSRLTVRTSTDAHQRAERRATGRRRIDSDQRELTVRTDTRMSAPRTVPPGGPATGGECGAARRGRQVEVGAARTPARAPHQRPARHRPRHAEAVDRQHARGRRRRQGRGSIRIRPLPPRRSSGDPLRQRLFIARSIDEVDARAQDHARAVVDVIFVFLRSSARR